MGDRVAVPEGDLRPHRDHRHVRLEAALGLVHQDRLGGHRRRGTVHLDGDHDVGDAATRAHHQAAVRAVDRLTVGAAARGLLALDVEGLHLGAIPVEHDAPAQGAGPRCRHGGGSGSRLLGRCRRLRSGLLGRLLDGLGLDRRCRLLDLDHLDRTGGAAAASSHVEAAGAQEREQLVIGQAVQVDGGRRLGRRAAAHVVEPVHHGVDLQGVRGPGELVLVLRIVRGEVLRHRRAGVDRDRVPEPLAHPLLAEAVLDVGEGRGPCHRVLGEAAVGLGVALEAVHALGDDLLPHGDPLGELLEVRGAPAQDALVVVRDHAGHLEALGLGPAVDAREVRRDLGGVAGLDRLDLVLGEARGHGRVLEREAGAAAAHERREGPLVHVLGQVPPVGCTRVGALTSLATEREARGAGVARTPLVLGLLGEVVRDGLGLAVGEPERRHAHPHLLAERVDVVEEGVEPVALELVALAREHGRSERPAELVVLGLLVVPADAVHVLDERVPVLVDEPGPRIGRVALLVVRVVVGVLDPDTTAVVRGDLAHEVPPVRGRHGQELVDRDLHGLRRPADVRVDVRQAHDHGLEVLLPVLLPLGALLGEVLHGLDRRGHGLVGEREELGGHRVLVAVLVLEGDLRLVDHVAGGAVLLPHGACASVGRELLVAGVPALAGDVVVHEPQDEGGDRVDLLVREVEPRHAQLLLGVLDLAEVEGARVGELPLQPAVVVVVVQPRQGLLGLVDRLGHDVVRQLGLLLARVVLVGEAEVELVHGLGGPLRELRADRHHVLHAVDLVARVAALVADVGLADGHREGLVVGPLALELGLQAGATLLLEEPAGLLLEDLAVHGDAGRGPAVGGVPEDAVRVLHDVRGDVGRVAIGETQVRHLSLGPVGLRVLEPREEPLLGDLRVDAAEVGTVLVVAARLLAEVVGERLLALVRRGVVAGVAADEVHHLATALRVALNRQVGELGVLVVGVEELGHGRDRVLVPLLAEDVATLAVVALHDDLVVAVVLQVEDLGHPGGRTVVTRVGDPRLDPVGRQLALHLEQGRTRAALGREPLDLVARVAAVALDEAVALGHDRGVLGDQLHRGGVALHAPGLGVLGGQHRVVPVVLLVPVVLVGPGLLLGGVAGTVVDVLEGQRLAGPPVARGAAELLGGVRRLARQEQVEPRVGGVRLRRVLEACALHPHVARGAHVDARLLGEVEVEVDPVEDVLLDLQVGADEVEAREVPDLVGHGGGDVARVEGLDLLLDALEVAARHGEGLLSVGHARAVGRQGGLCLRPVARGHLDLLPEGLTLGREVGDQLLLGLHLGRGLHGGLALEVEDLPLQLGDHRLVGGLVVPEGVLGVVDGRLQLLEAAPLRSQGRLGRGHGLGQGVPLLHEALGGEGGARLLGLLELHGAELALVVLPFGAGVVEHRPHHRQGEEGAGEQEPAVESGDVIEGVAAISHGKEGLASGVPGGRRGAQEGRRQGPGAVEHRAQRIHHTFRNHSGIPTRYFRSMVQRRIIFSGTRAVQRNRCMKTW